MLNPRAEIVRLSEKRTKLQHNLEELENQIYNYEGSYLKESPYGNAIVGFRMDDLPKSTDIRPSDRIFSSSSVSWAHAHQSDMEATSAQDHAAKPVEESSKETVEMDLAEVKDVSDEESKAKSTPSKRTPSRSSKRKEGIDLDESIVNTPRLTRSKRPKSD